MEANLDKAITYFRQNKDQFIGDLQELLRIPSVSTDPAKKEDVHRAAEWIVAQLKAIGIEHVAIFPTPVHPIIYGDHLKAGKDVPTVLVYGHYDVQPAEPLDLWNSDPFEPVIKGENLYARGASDMKGQLLASLTAIQSIMTQGAFPVNLKFLFEGEEEIGSPSLRTFIENNKEMLASDVALNPDTGIIDVDLPSIVYGLRGLAYFELHVYGPSHDLHSGVYGGVVQNPADALCSLVAGLHDKDGKVTLAGFYDRVRTLSNEERAELARLPMDDEFYLRQTGAPAVWGEKGFTSTERIGARPTLDVNGLYSGFTGEGSKTIIPAWAMAKISSRLVPDQDPKEVHQQLLSYLEKNAPKTIRWELTYLSGAPACLVDRNHPACKALAKAMETVWGKRPVFQREGGSVPVATDMQEVLKIDSVLTGFGLPDDNIHAPNEKLNLTAWTRGVETLIRFFYNLA
jgi:acetylornithine deacetylase/succinyl-diaminopimelate desuccinylase-like protein